jgi:replicative DNA helicase
VAASLQPPDFSLEKHRRIFARMDDLAERGERIDPGTLANELMGAGELPAK